MASITCHNLDIFPYHKVDCGRYLLMALKMGGTRSSEISNILLNHVPILSQPHREKSGWECLRIWDRRINRS